MLITKTRKGLKILSPAKINLFLEVLGKRQDGFHEIESIMQTVSLFDTLYLHPISKGIEVVTTHPELASSRANLVYKAAELVKKEYGIGKGVRIILEKRIPIGGGLGGGSSNAAAVLLGLNRLWNLGLSQEEMSFLGARLGSDVPFFTYGGTALVKGRGEIILPLMISAKFHYLLLKPPISIPTKNIYKNIRFYLTKPASNGILPLVNKLQQKQAGYKEIQKLLYNRLENVAMKLYPVLKDTHRAFQKISHPGILLSGSGSTIFKLCSSRTEAKTLATVLSRRNLGQSFIVNGLD
ncbi:MAG: 4-(cytidine 5'-diphospho)-2-C-methyl-D-erythritol kinase [Planctomycetes bacterium]|nr:4-(cytidine 5'-diphospho)-2-C-methyl-D-erythritol kinase [Planctomycetota bacterium]